MHRRPLLLVLAALLAAAAARADGGVLRVGTSGDYPPFSSVTRDDPPVFDGFDVALARAYALDRGLALVLERFRWPDLTKALESNRFDVAMSGVTVTPTRSAAGRYSVPVAETGAVVLARQPERFDELRDLNRSVIRIGVNAGGYLESVANATFPRATIVAIPDNAAVLQALVAENVHAVVTDNIEAQRWIEAGPGLKRFGPLTRDRKAFLVRAGRPDLAADLDRWLLAREADGTLATLRRSYLGENAGPATAQTLTSLLAAVDERLALMPIVAVAKRRQGIALVAERREGVVLQASIDATREAALRAGVPAPPTAAVRAVFRAQIEAAKQVQWSAIKAKNVRPETVPSVTDVLRPALLRIGEKIARLLVALPEGLGREPVRAAARDQLRAPHLTEASRLAIADAIAALSRAPRAQ
ncbi:MAG: transporter substrate-binding domain-containing protein [Myxococcota bacterium]